MTFILNILSSISYLIYMSQIAKNSLYLPPGTPWVCVWYMERKKRKNTNKREPWLSSNTSHRFGSMHRRWSRLVLRRRWARYVLLGFDMLAWGSRRRGWVAVQNAGDMPTAFSRNSTRWHWLGSLLAYDLVWFNMLAWGSRCR
jgi:hypothetical protein